MVKEHELARMLSGRQVVYDPAHGLDQRQVDAGAFALCRLTCNAVRPTKPCEHRCMAELDPGIATCTHMDQMRARAVAVLKGAQARRPTTEETRAKLAAAKRANWADPEYRARQSAAVRRGKANSHLRVVDLPR